MPRFKPTPLSSFQRRKILSGLMKLLVSIGLIFVSVPFISSLMINPTTKKEQGTSHWVITFPVSALIQGKVKQFNWAGRTIWVYTRTDNEISLLKKSNPMLVDAFSALSEQPESMRNNFRSEKERYFVFIPQENKRGCQVHLNDMIAEKQALFIEPCYGAQYDAAGRILKNTGHAEQQNLVVPEHIVEAGILKLGVWTPKIK